MKILIIQTAFIGDVILATPIITKLKEEYSGSKISFLTTPSGAQILKNNPDLDRIIKYDKKKNDKGIRAFLKLAKELKTEKYDVVYCLHRYLRSSILSYATGANKRIGYSNAAGKYLFNKLVNYDKTKHEVEKILNFTNIDINKKKIGKENNFSDKDSSDFSEKNFSKNNFSFSIDNSDRYPLKIYPGQTEKKIIDNIFIENKIYNRSKIITIAPGSKWNTKRWPKENFSELIKNIVKENSSKENNLEKIKIILVGGRDELKLNLNFESSSVINLIGKTSLLELAEIIKRSDIVLTNDSSPIHIAAAFEKPKIIAIFGATTKELGFFPWKKNSIVLEKKELECRPCGLHGGDKCPKKHFKCMKEITVETVYKHIIENIYTNNYDVN